MKQTDSGLPKVLYIPNRFYPWFASEKKGICNIIPFKLEFVTSSPEYINTIKVLYKLNDLNFIPNTGNVNEVDLFIDKLMGIDSVLIGKNKLNQWKIITSLRDPLYDYKYVGVYKITGYNLKNENRKVVEIKQKKTKEERKRAANKIVLIDSISDRYIEINAKALREFLNIELAKYGFSKLPEKAVLSID